MTIELKRITPSPTITISPDRIVIGNKGIKGDTGTQGAAGTSPTAANVGAVISGADALTTPLSTHGIAVEVSGVVKRTTWANIVATIQTAFASVFQPLAAVLTNTTASFTTAQESKLSGIEAGADVTDATNIGSSIAGATPLTTPTDTDALGVESSGVVKRTTWANIKATLKTYFDTLYAAIFNRQAHGTITTSATLNATTASEHTGAFTASWAATIAGLTAARPSMLFQFVVSGGGTPTITLSGAVFDFGTTQTLTTLADGTYQAIFSSVDDNTNVIVYVKAL